MPPQRPPNVRWKMESNHLQSLKRTLPLRLQLMHLDPPSVNTLTNLLHTPADFFFHARFSLLVCVCLAHISGASRRASVGLRTAPFGDGKFELQLFDWFLY